MIRMYQQSFTMYSIIVFSFIIGPGFGHFMEGIKFHVRTITAENFESDVLESKDAWVLATKGGEISEEKWQEEENQLRGVINVAFVHLTTDDHFLYDRGYLERDEPTPVALVFPYGGIKTKKTKYARVESLKEAKRKSLSSLSENYVSWISTRVDVESFIRNAYQSWPPRFPVVLTTERNIVPPLYRAISLRYSKYFNFGIVHVTNAKAVIGLVDNAKIPRLDILVATLTENKTMTFNGLTYDEAYGPVKYKYLIRYLYSAHDKHWSELPRSDQYGENDLEEFYKEDLHRIFANPVEESPENEIKLDNITEITFENHKTICGDLTKGFCVVAFFDGKSEFFEETFSTFSEIRKYKFFQDKALKFIWIDATCHPEFGQTFGVSIDVLPEILVTKPQRRVFAKYSGKYEKDGVVQFIERVFSGRVSLAPYSRFPDDITNRICVSSNNSVNSKQSKKENKKESQEKGKKESKEESQEEEKKESEEESRQEL